MKKLLLTISLFLIPPFFFNSCEKEIEFQIKKEKVSGFVQKGPFFNGSTILMVDLNASLEQTGKMYNTQIKNNIGSFEIDNIELSSGFVLFSANGLYYDEVKGDISTDFLNLYALTDITDINMVNVNILTHLEKRRIEYLVKQKTGFAEAKKTAQEEILAIFGFKNDEMQESETLDIAVNHNDNAILLAISLILQGTRSVGDLTKLLAGISTDIVEDGILDNENTLTDLRISTLELDLESIRQYLVGRYKLLGINVTIPNFEKYVTDFLAYTATEPWAGSISVTNITTTGATLNGTVNPNGSSTVVTFEYGLTTEYGSTVTASPRPVSGNINTNVSAEITDLSPGTIYHFRIKAENEFGVIYGTNTTFNTLGQVPTVVTSAATNVSTTGVNLHGTVNANHLTATVTFEYGLTTEYGSTIKATPSLVSGNTTTNIRAALTGLAPGTTYHFRLKAENELGISYSDDRTFLSLNSGEVYNSTTGKIWMDRNLGASRVATGSTDSEAYGDLYQWGRGTDGHEKRNSPTTSTLSDIDTPGHGSFILSPNSPYDWRSPQNTNLWQSVSGTNNPCPAGFRLPTAAEWEAELLSWSSRDAAGAFASPLKLPLAGDRYSSNGWLYNVGSYGFYWSATVSGSGSQNLGFGSSDANMYSYNRARGYSVRCIKE